MRVKKTLHAPEITAGSDYTDTNPASPTTGLTVFSRLRGRRLPSFVGPTGQDSRLQPFLGSNRVARMSAVNNTTTPTYDGLSASFTGSAVAAVAQASTTFFTSMARIRSSSSAAAGVGSGLRTATGQWFLSNTANMGGFHFIARFGIANGAVGNRGFIGLSSQASAGYAPTTNPSTQLNQIGFYWDAAHTTLHFGTAGSAVGASVDLGANFPVTTAATYFYEVALFSPSGGGQTAYWCATRLNDGIVSQGGPVTGTITMPSIGTMLAAHMYLGTGTSTAAVSLDIQSLYIETDN